MGFLGANNTTLFNESCHKCGRQVVEKIVKSQGFAYHPECFACELSCTKCKVPLTGCSSFHRRQGQPFCDNCVPKDLCAACNMPVTASATYFGNDVYHLQCFRCSGCDKQLNGTFYTGRQDKTSHFCSQGCLDRTEHHVGAAVHRAKDNCMSRAGCDKPFSGTATTVGEKTYHSDFFQDSICSRPLQGECFSHTYQSPFSGSASLDIAESMPPKCTQTSPEVDGDVCWTCKQVITSLRMEFGSHFFHPECLKCDGCQMQFTAGIYEQTDGKLLCGNCLPKTMCEACHKPITDCETVVGGLSYHAECFTCTRCSRPLLDTFFPGVTGQHFCSVTCQTSEEIAAVKVGPTVNSDELESDDGSDKEAILPVEVDEEVNADEAATDVNAAESELERCNGSDTEAILSVEVDTEAKTCQGNGSCTTATTGTGMHIMCEVCKQTFWSASGKSNKCVLCR